MISVSTMRPFTRCLMTIGTIPTSYLVSMTYDEQLLWFCNYLEKEVIPALNNNAEALKEVQDLYVELKKYVDDYFSNLDVQEEINNKLDEMAESGQLADIIARYLEVSSVLAFDTKSDLKNADNLNNGSICKTLGESVYNDGKGSFYKIRTITSEDVIDGVNIVDLAVSNTLIAERIKQLIIDVTKYGADNKGLIDCSNIIQNLIDNNPLSSIYFPNGKYLISTPISIKTGNATSVNLIFDDNAILFTESSIDELINVGKISSGDYDRYTEGNITTIKGGIFDASNTQRAIYLTSDKKQTRLLNINIINVQNTGVYIDRNVSTSSSTSSDSLLNNISITGTKNYTDNNRGIYLYGNDNEISNLRITGIKNAIDINGGGNLFNDCHLTAAYNSATTEMFNNSIGVNINGSGNNFFNNFYIDTYGKNFVFNSDNMRTYINNMQVLYYSSDSQSNNYGFIYNARAYCYCNNCIFNFPNSTNENMVVKTTDTLEYNSRKYPTIKKLINFNLCRAFNLTHNNDWFFEMSLNNEYAKNYNLNYNPWSIIMEQNKWYKLMLVNGGIHEFTIQVGNDQLSDVILKVDSSSSTITCTDKYHTTGGHYKKYEIALVNGYTDETSNYMCYLAIRATDNDTSLNINIADTKNLWGNQNYACGETSPLESPNVIASSNLYP